LIGNSLQLSGDQAALFADIFGNSLIVIEPYYGPVPWLRPCLIWKVRISAPNISAASRAKLFFSLIGHPPTADQAKLQSRFY
jgi:hypothetical protein